MEFGNSSSISSDGLIMVVGSPKSDVNGINNSGESLYISMQNDSTSSWDELNKFTESDIIDNSISNGYFGRTVSINDDAAVLVVSCVGSGSSNEIRTYQC